MRMPARDDGAPRTAPSVTGGGAAESFNLPEAAPPGTRRMAFAVPGRRRRAAAFPSK